MERITGGLADYMPDEAFDPEQLAKGIEVELEHTDSYEEAKEIAKDHLMEIPNYYDYLEEMEIKATSNPVKSKAQWRWAHWALKNGVITQKQFNEIMEGSKSYKRLPERVGTRKNPQEALDEGFITVEEYERLIKEDNVSRSPVKRAIRQTRQHRPSAKKKLVSRIVEADALLPEHKRYTGRKRVKRLTKDATFDLDVQRAYKKYGIGPDTSFGKKNRKRLREVTQHPSHLDQRKVAKHARKGWKEFAGVDPNHVVAIEGVPVKGSFNGVLITEIVGKTAESGRDVVIQPPQGKPMYLIWSNGGRTFELVGTPAATAELARDFAAIGETVLLKHIDYLASRYPKVPGRRRTYENTRGDLGIYFTHEIAHEAYLTWNEESGSGARFPIRVIGARGKKLVDGAGIHL